MESFTKDHLLLLDAAWVGWLSVIVSEYEEKQRPVTAQCETRKLPARQAIDHVDLLIAGQIARNFEGCCDIAEMLFELLPRRPSHHARLFVRSNELRQVVTARRIVHASHAVVTLRSPCCLIDLLLRRQSSEALRVL
jgi:hypothetical protein